MSGYDLSNRVPFRLMQGRLGTYDKPPFDPRGVDPNIPGVEEQSMRFRANGGNRQQERMIKDKRRTLNHAVWNSYQAAEIVRTDADYKKPVRALINPNKVKQDYDDKILSVGYEYNFKAGSVFEWLGTNTYWLVYLQDLTELAYFRGNIRKCSYEIQWEDEDDKSLHSAFIALRGPVETKINSIQKNGISVDVPNYSLSFLMPKTEENLKHFQRYAKFYLHNDVGQKICWRVERVDWVSTPGILEIAALEYYANEFEDDVENGLVGSLKIAELDPNPSIMDNIILGETFIKPKKEYEFIFAGNIVADWIVDKKYPVKLQPQGKTVKVTWDSTYSGQFDLSYGGFTRTIVVESLF